MEDYLKASISAESPGNLFGTFILIFLEVIDSDPSRSTIPGTKRRGAASDGHDNRLHVCAGKRMSRSRS